MRKSLSYLVLIVIGLLFATGCRTAGQIKAEGVKYQTVSRANAEATATAEAVRHIEAENALQEEISRQTIADEVAARRQVIWWRNTIAISMLVVGGLAGGYAMTGSAWAWVRLATARAQQAENRARYATFALDAKTRQYPAIASPSGNFLLVPGAGLSLDMRQVQAADKVMAAGMNHTQAAGAIAQEARKARNSQSDGVAAVNPMMVDAKAVDTPEEEES